MRISHCPFCNHDLFEKHKGYQICNKCITDIYGSSCIQFEDSIELKIENYLFVINFLDETTSVINLSAWDYGLVLTLNYTLNIENSAQLINKMHTIINLL